MTENHDVEKIMNGKPPHRQLTRCSSKSPLMNTRLKATSEPELEWKDIVRLIRSPLLVLLITFRRPCSPQLTSWYLCGATCSSREV